jgi:hypothetical protein
MNFIKELFLSVAYLLVALVIASLLYVFIGWFLDDVVFSVLNWFNSLNFWLKIFLFVLGIGSILRFVLDGVVFLNGLICGLINLLFPINLFTIIVGALLSVSNSILLLMQFWKAVPYWNFWFVMEFIVIASFIISMNSIFIPRKVKYDN